MPFVWYTTVPQWRQGDPSRFESAVAYNKMLAFVNKKFNAVGRGPAGVYTGGLIVSNGN